MGQGPRFFNDHNHHSKITIYLTSFRSRHSAVYYRDRVFVIGGSYSRDISTPLAAVDVFDPSDETWCSFSPLPIPVVDAQVSNLLTCWFAVNKTHSGMFSICLFVCLATFLSTGICTHSSPLCHLRRCSCCMAKFTCWVVWLVSFPCVTIRAKTNRSTRTKNEEQMAAHSPMTHSVKDMAKSVKSILHPISRLRPPNAFKSSKKTRAYGKLSTLLNGWTFRIDFLSTRVGPFSAPPSSLSKGNTGSKINARLQLPLIRQTTSEDGWKKFPPEPLTRIAFRDCFHKLF